MKRTFTYLMLLSFFMVSASSCLICQDDDEYYDDEEYYYEDSDEEKGPDKFSVSLFVDYNLTMGDFGNSWDNGFGILAGFEYRLTKNISLSMVTGYIKWEENPNFDWGDLEYDLTDIPLKIMGVYYLSGFKDFHPYLGAEAGINFLKKADKQIIYDETNRGRVFETRHSFTSFGFAPVVGGMMPFGGFFLNFQAKYVILFEEHTNPTFLALNAGITYPF